LDTFKELLWMAGSCLIWPLSISCNDFVNVLQLSDLNLLEYACVCECVVFISEMNMKVSLIAIWLWYICSYCHRYHDGHCFLKHFFVHYCTVTFRQSMSNTSTSIVTGWHPMSIYWYIFWKPGLCIAVFIWYIAEGNNSWNEIFRMNLYLIFSRDWMKTVCSKTCLWHRGMVKVLWYHKNV